MIILRQKEYSGIGTKYLYKKNLRTMSPVSAKRAAIVQKRKVVQRIENTAEKAGGEAFRRVGVGGFIAGPGLPVPGLSWGVGAGYAIAPNTVNKIPVLGNYTRALEGNKVSTKIIDSGKTAGKKIGTKLTKVLFKTGR